MLFSAVAAAVAFAVGRRTRKDGREAADCLFRHVAEAHRVLASPGKRRRFDAGKMLNRAFRQSSSSAHGHHHHHHHH